MTDKIQTSLDWLKEITKRLALLPPLPHIAAKAMELLTQEDPDMSEIIDIIRMDQGLSMKILSYVNSAYVGLPQPVTDIKKAVLLAGGKSIKELVLKTVISDAIFRVFNSEVKDIQKILFRHSLATAVVSEHITKLLSLPFRLEAFMGGLLHDIGKLLLLLCYPKKYKEIHKVVNDPMRSTQHRVAENMVLGINHNVAGRILMEAWKIPELYKSVAEMHHNSQKELQEKEPPCGLILLNIVQIANAIAHNILADIPDSFLIADSIARLSIRLGINRLRLKDLGNNIIKSLDEASKLVSLGEDSEILYFNSLKNSVIYLKNILDLKASIPSYLKELKNETSGVELIVERLFSGINSKYRPKELLVFFLNSPKSLVVIKKRVPEGEGFINSSVDSFISSAIDEHQESLEAQVAKLLDCTLRDDTQTLSKRIHPNTLLFVDQTDSKEIFMGALIKDPDPDRVQEHEIRKYFSLGKDLYMLISQLK